MKKMILLLLSGILIFTSCRNSGSTEKAADAALPYRVGVEENINNVRSVGLSAIGSDIEYIPLETRPECMLQRIAKIALTDSFIFVSDGSKMMLFERSGKFLRQIGANGRGPEEYMSARDFIVDASSREIYILSSRMVVVFDFNGRFKKNFKTDFISFQFVAKDNSNLIYHLINMSRPSDDTAYSWIITDKEGVVLTKIRNYLKRISQPGLIVSNSPLYIFNETPYFEEFGIDTLYYFQGAEKEPYAIFKTGKIKMEPDLLLTPDTFKEISDRIKEKIWINDIIEDNEYLYLKISWGLSDSTSYCIFNKKSSEFTVLKDNGFINDIDGGVTFWPKNIIKDNILVDYIDAFDLLNFINKNQKAEVKAKDRSKAEQLSVLTKQLTETSNPVVMVIK